MSPALCVNGRFLTQVPTGVQRYAAQIVQALDAILERGGAFSEVVLCVPRGARVPFGLKNLKVEEVGWLRGHAWEQTELCWRARGGVLLNLGNSGPLLHSRSVVVMHDAIAFKHPQTYTKAYRRFHQVLGHALLRHSRIATVSSFSRSELAGVAGIETERITVAPIGCDHFDTVVPDLGVLDRLNLGGSPFFLIVGNLARHKNVPFAVEAFSRLVGPEARLVVVGRTNPTVFSDTDKMSPVPGLVLAGVRSDAELAALYQHAAALVFPSLYEGFGVPPLEAIAHGCPVIAADIPPVRESCGSAAHYFRPGNVGDLVALMRKALINPESFAPSRAACNAVVSRFKWRTSAETLAQLCVSAIP